MVDMTLQRHVLHLGSTQHQEYPAGMCSTQFAVPKIDLDGLKKSWLNNVGLLLVLPVFVRLSYMHVFICCQAWQTDFFAGAFER